eukprot:gene2606-biopygen92
MCRVGSAVWRRAAPCAVRTLLCGAVRRYVPCGQRRGAPCGRRADHAPCGHRRAAPSCAVCAVRAVWATRRATRKKTCDVPCGMPCGVSFPGAA